MESDYYILFYFILFIYCISYFSFYVFMFYFTQSSTPTGESQLHSKRLSPGQMILAKWRDTGQFTYHEVKVSLGQMEKDDILGRQM